MDQFHEDILSSFKHTDKSSNKKRKILKGIDSFFLNVSQK
jgi:hypothetical protein